MRLVDADWLKEHQDDTPCWNDTNDLISHAPTVDAITMEQISKYVIEINKILEEEKDDARWCAGLRYSLRVLDKYCVKENEDGTDNQKSYR